MNAKHKKEAKRISDELSELQGATQFLIDEMQNIYDGKSESWQEGEKGEEIEQEISALQECADSIVEAIDKLSDYIA